MKKLLEKIVTLALAFVGLLFVVLMLVLMFKPEYAQNLNNQLVHVLVIIFSGVFGILTFLNIYSAFSDAEKINSVLLFKGKESATKATISVVKKTAGLAIKQVPGAKMKKVSLYVNENNDVKMKIDIKAETEDVEELVTRVRATVVSAFEEVLGLSFAAVDFRLVKVKNAFKPDQNKIDEKIAEFKAELEAEKAAKAEKEEKAEETKEEATEAVKAEVTADQVSEEVIGEEIEAIEAAQKEDAPEGVVTEEESLEEVIEASDKAIAEAESFEEQTVEEVVAEIPEVTLDKEINALDEETEN